MPHYIYTDRSQEPITGKVTQDWKVQGMNDWLMEMHSKYLPPRSQPFTGPEIPIHRGVIVWAGVAANILDADKMLLESTGIIAAKRADVCCEIFQASEKQLELVT